MSHLNKIQTALEPLKKIGKKSKYISMTILGLVELFKTIKRPDPTVTYFDSLFLVKYER